MNEETTTAAIEAEDDGFDDTGWDEEPVAVAEEPEEPEEQTETEEPEQTGDGEDQPAPEQEPNEPEPEAKPEAPADDSFELKYMGETRRVGKAEAIVLAQKGMDYDRIRSERDSMTTELEGLRADKNKLAEYEGFLDKLARSVGQDIPSMIDTTLAKMMVAEEAKKGNKITEEFAKQRIQFDREKAEFAKQQGSAVKNTGGDAPEKAETQPEPKKAAEDEAAAKARREDEANAFLAAYPDVDPKAIPKEVMEKWRGGQPLLQAYMAYENKKLKAELAALEQNTKNSARSTGSAKSAGAGRTTDPFFAGWDD